MYVYGIKDKLAEEFGPLFSAKNDAIAARSFVQEIPVHFKQNLEEFELHNLGKYNQETGEIIVDDRHLVDVNQAVEKAIANKESDNA